MMTPEITKLAKGGGSLALKFARSISKIITLLFMGALVVKSLRSGDLFTAVVCAFCFAMTWLSCYD